MKPRELSSDPTSDEWFNSFSQNVANSAEITELFQTKNTTCYSHHSSAAG